MPIRICVFVLLLSLLCTPAAIFAAVQSPSERVKVTVEEILTILRDKSLDWNTRQKKIEDIIEERFDFRSMSQSVLATHWKRASPAERERFVHFFSQYLELTYAKKLKNYTNEYVKYGKEKVRGKRAVVDTFIVTDTNEIPVSYKLRFDDEQWYAYDVVIENQSLVNNYRTVYSAIVRSEGMGGLLDNLEGQIRLEKEQSQRLY